MEPRIPKILERVRSIVLTDPVFNKVVKDIILINGELEESIEEGFNDVDIIVVVKNGMSKFDIVQKMSKALFWLSREFEILVNAYPVFEKDLLTKKSMFLKNVIDNGRSFL